VSDNQQYEDDFIADYLSQTAEVVFSWRVPGPAAKEPGRLAWLQEEIGREKAVFAYRVDFLRYPYDGLCMVVFRYGRKYPDGERQKARVRDIHGNMHLGVHLEAPLVQRITELPPEAIR
jgi:hypothetical protein